MNLSFLGCCFFRGYVGCRECTYFFVFPPWNGNTMTTTWLPYVFCMGELIQKDSGWPQVVLIILSNHLFQSRSSSSSRLWKEVYFRRLQVATKATYWQLNTYRFKHIITTVHRDPFARLGPQSKANVGNQYLDYPPWNKYIPYQGTFEDDFPKLGYLSFLEGRISIHHLLPHGAKDQGWRHNILHCPRWSNLNLPHLTLRWNACTDPH